MLFRSSPTGEFPHRLELFTRRKDDEPYLTMQVAPEKRAAIPNLRVPEKTDGLWIRMTAGKKFDAKSGYRIRTVAHPDANKGVVEGEPNDESERAEGLRLGEVAKGYLHTASDLDRFRLAVGRPLPASVDVAEPKPADTGDTAESLSQAEPPPRDVGVAGADAGDATASDAESGPSYVHPIESVPEKTPPEHVVQVGLRPISENDRLALVQWPGKGSGVEQKRVMEAHDKGETLKICNLPVDEGLLELGVRGKSVEERRARGGFTYELTSVDIASNVEGLEIEPNDGRDVADRLEFGVRRTGFISRNGDRDIYAFGVADPRFTGGDAGEPSGVSPSGDAGADPEDAAGSDVEMEPAEPVGVHVALEANKLNLGFKLLDSNGALVAEIDRSGAGANETTDMDLPPGLYFVEVTSARKSACTPYRLRVSRK